MKPLQVTIRLGVWSTFSQVSLKIPFLILISLHQLDKAFLGPKSVVCRDLSKFGILSWLQIGPTAQFADLLSTPSPPAQVYLPGWPRSKFSLYLLKFGFSQSLNANNAASFPETSNGQMVFRLQPMIRSFRKLFLHTNISSLNCSAVRR